MLKCITIGFGVIQLNIDNISSDNKYSILFKNKIYSSSVSNRKESIFTNKWECRNKAKPSCRIDESSFKGT